MFNKKAKSQHIGLFGLELLPRGQLLFVDYQLDISFGNQYSISVLLAKHPPRPVHLFISFDGHYR